MTGHGTHRSSLSGRFSHDPDLDFEIRTVLGGAFSGAADVGEVLAAVADVGTDHRAWFRAWDALGDRLAATGESCAARGRRVSAASAYLRAATYLGVAVNAVSGLEDDAPLLPTFRKHRAAWDRWVDLVDLDVERFPIPYEGTTLPGYFFRAPGVDPGARGPVVVAVNGSDGSLPALWSAVVSGAVRRGYHALVFDGPGQQSVLFEHGVPFRPDFEAVLTPVLDAVVARADVDPDRVAVYGISQAGYWVTRALAFEHRPAAAVVDPGVVDVATSWEREVPKSLLKLLDKDDDHAFDRDMALGLRLSKGAARTWRFRARPYGVEGYAATLREVRRYDASDVAAQVTTPLLVTSPEDEQFWPDQPERLAGLVPGATLVTFSDDEGASGHCEPLGRALVEQRVLDWLDERLAR